MKQKYVVSISPYEGPYKGSNKSSGIFTVPGRGSYLAVIEDDTTVRNTPEVFTEAKEMAAILILAGFFDGDKPFTITVESN